MNLFGFNIAVSRVERTGGEMPVAQKAFYSPDDWLRGEGGGGLRLSNAYEQVVWVYRAVNALAEQVANVPFLFSAGERGREDLITSGPLLDFYARPHPQLNRFQYWELRVIWLMLRGECFRVPIYQDSSGRLSTFKTQNSRMQHILLLDPARFQHIIEDHQLIGWRYTGLGLQAPLASQVFLPEEVWFEKLPNPFDFWRGLSPLYVAGLAAQSDFAAGAFMRGIIENNCDTGIIVRTDKWLSPQQREEIVGALRERKRRAGQADRPVLLLGSAEVIKPQLSSSDLQFLENRKFSRSEICAAFGVPEEIVTTTDHAKYDVMAGARLNFIENRIAPLCSRLEAEEDVTVKSIDPRASGWFDLDSLPILQEARRNRLVAAKTGFDMGIPFNELNRVLDLGFKRLPWGDSGYLSNKLQRVDAPSPESPKSKVQSPKSQCVDLAAMVDFGNPIARAHDFLSQLKERRIHAAVAQNHDLLPHECGVPESGGSARHVNSAETTPDPHLVRKLSRFFFEQRGRVLAGLPVLLRQLEELNSSAAASGSSEPASRGTEAYQRREQSAQRQCLRGLLDLPFENAQLFSHINPFLLAELTSIATRRSVEISVAEIGAAYLETWREALEQINSETLALLESTVLEGLALNEPALVITARVKAVFNHAADARALAVACSETAAARLWRLESEGVRA